MANNSSSALNNVEGADPAGGPVTFSQNLLSPSGNYTVDQQEAFWYQPDINPLNWNKVFPYALLILQRQIDAQGNTGYIESQQGRFVLPFPPESISIGMTPAATVQATLGGIVEEHNGIPFENITFSGTLGVLPFRGTSPSRNSTPTANSIILNVNQVPIIAANNIVVPSTITSSITGTGSGYYQMELLKNFLKNYHNLKKTKAGAAFQLAVAMYKQQAMYLIKVDDFTADQNASSPLEYRYSLRMKAWKRIDPSPYAISDYGFTAIVNNPNLLQQSLAKLQDANSVIQNYVAALDAAAGDITSTVLTPLQQTIFFQKDILGAALNLSDLGPQIIQQSQAAVMSYFASVASTSGVNGLYALFPGATPATLKAVNDILNLSYLTQQPTVGAGISTNKTIYDVHPGNDPFNNPQNYFNIWNALNISSLNLPPVTMRSILQAREQVRTLSRLDFENFRNSIQTVAADFCDAVGAGSAVYNTTFQRNNTISTNVPTENDFNIIFALNTSTLELARLAATFQTNLFNVPSINYVAGAASRSGIAFNIPRSKFSVPFPYGTTLEELSFTYLGDPNRWMEIATLNGLKEPFVDEQGFDLTLITNGKGNNVYVADSTNLYLGQTVWISSTDTSRTVRQIIKITPISDSYVQLTLNGDSDLARFSTLAGAVLHAFLPDTVNSMQTIFIPSANDPQDNDYQTKEVPGLSSYNNFLLAGGVDLLLTQSNDLAITPDGDCRLAVGLPNIIQQARIALNVVQGTLNQHPNFGIPRIAGQSTADVDVNQVAKAVTGLFAGNSTFSGVTNVFVNKAGPVLNISLTANVRGIQQGIPITFSLPVT